MGNYRGKPQGSCGFTEDEIRARSTSTQGSVWKVHCLNGAGHKHDDKHPSAFYYPETGYYGCNVCDLRGFASDRTNIGQQKRVDGRRQAGSDRRRKEFRPSRIPEDATLTATHGYKRLDGSTVHRVRRYDWVENMRDGTTQARKEYLPQHLVDGVWKIGIGDVDWQPYNAYAISNAKAVYVVEGEKCADALREVAPGGTAVITSAFGTNSAWKTDWSCLRKFIEEDDRSLVFIPDCDKPGEKYIHSVAWELKLDTINRIHIGDLDRKDGYDVADWLSEGFTWENLPGPVEIRVKLKEEFEERKQQSKTPPNDKPHKIHETAYDREIGCLSVDDRIVENSTITPRRVDWLIHQFVAVGQATIIYGDSGAGKTTIVRALIRHIVEGTDPFRTDDQSEEGPAPRGRALWWLGEEDIALTKPKFAAAGISTDDVDMLDRGHKWSCVDTIELQPDGSREIVKESPHTELLNRIDEAASEGRPYRAIVIDPLSKMLGDINRSDVFERRWDETVVTLESRGLAVIGILHPRKDNAKDSTLEASLKGTERLFSLPRVVAYARAGATKVLLRQAKERDDGVTHSNPIRDRFNRTANGDLSEENGLIGVLSPLKNSHEPPQKLLAWQYSIVIGNGADESADAVAEFSSIPWRSSDFDHHDLDGRSFGAAVAGRYELYRSEKQTKQEQLAAVRLEDRHTRKVNAKEFVKALFDTKKQWTASELKVEYENAGRSFDSGAAREARDLVATYIPTERVWSRKVECD